MDSVSLYKKYTKKEDYSYTLGAFPTIELLQNKPEAARKVYLHSDLNSVHQREVVYDLCSRHQIPYETNDRIVAKLRDKENCMAICVFPKYKSTLNPDTNHVVLVNPSDMGNLGTIIRTCIGFGVKDLAIIEPAVDLFHPKVIRASMGAIFQLNFQLFQSFDEYLQQYAQKDRALYPFMLQENAAHLQDLPHSDSKHFSLIFGNEATGLDDSFAQIGSSVIIRHSHSIDSLNLSMAVGIGLYEFTR